jgi:glutaredoxin 3
MEGTKEQLDEYGLPAAAARVVVYTLSGCGYCRRAFSLLHERGIEFEEVNGDADPEFRRKVLRRTGGYTVPQVVVLGVPIGGSTELAALDGDGTLAKVLQLPTTTTVDDD